MAVLIPDTRRWRTMRRSPRRDGRWMRRFNALSMAARAEFFSNRMPPLDTAARLASLATGETVSFTLYIDNERGAD